MRVSRLLSLVLLASCLLPSAVLAKKDSAEKQPAFVLKSDVLTRIPEVSNALGKVEADPNDVVAWRALGQALAGRGAFPDAIRALESATKVAPKDPDAWCDLGATFIRGGQASKGLSALKHAVSIEPYHALAHYNIGIAHQTLGDYEAALDAFEYALTIDPALGDPRKNPGAAVNRMLPYVKTRLYMKSTGNAFALYTPVGGTTSTGTGSSSAAPVVTTPPGDQASDQALNAPLDKKPAPATKPPAKPKQPTTTPEEPNF